MKYKMLFVLLFISVSSLFATEQVCDILVYNDTIYVLPVPTHPMEPYFQRYPLKRPLVIITAIARGYVAKFEIRNNELWVVDIQAFGRNIIKRILKKDSMKVDWFSGVLPLSRNGSRDNSEGYIEIENGNVINIIFF